MAKPGRAAAYAAGPDDAASTDADPSGGSADESSEDPSSPTSSTGSADSDIGERRSSPSPPSPAAGGVQDDAGTTHETSEPDAPVAAEPTEPERESGRRARPDVSGGIGCAALLLPLIAVAGAVLCFFAGVLSTASGCSANGSALCSANGPWYAFALPVFVSPLVAAGTAIAAVTVRRHRSTWLAVGYGIVFISIIVGLAVASTGSG